VVHILSIYIYIATVTDNTVFEIYTKTSETDFIVFLFLARHVVAQLVEVAGSIPDGVIGIFQLHNPSRRTMTLGSTQPLT
jgi:hypothetical protein